MQRISRIKEYLEIALVVGLVVHFLVYSFFVRPFVGAIIDPHGVSHGLVQLDMDLWFWIAIATLGSGIVLYFMLVIANRIVFVPSTNSEKGLERIALVNVILACGQLALVLAYGR